MAYRPENDAAAAYADAQAARDPRLTREPAHRDRVTQPVDWDRLIGAWEDERNAAWLDWWETQHARAFEAGLDYCDNPRQCRAEGGCDH